MKAIILAAGYATQLYPLTERFPKPLLPVGGKPILDWLIGDLSPVIDTFIVVTNHRFAPQFREWSVGKPVEVIDDGTMDNETRLGAVNDIRLAAQGVDGDVLVMAGDNVLTFSLVPFVEYARRTGTACVMCHEERRPEALRRTAVITVDDTGLITSYEEKPEQPKGHLAVPPFYYYRAADVARIGEALEAGCGYDAPGSFAAWLSGKTPMHAWPMPGRRYDIGDMKSYEAVRDSYTGIAESGNRIPLRH